LAWPDGATRRFSRLRPDVSATPIEIDIASEQRAIDLGAVAERDDLDVKASLL